MKRYIFFLSLCLLPTAFVFAQPGSLDSSFNQDGLVKTKIGSVGRSYIHSLALQNDGKIVGAGTTFGGAGSVCALVRYNSNGSPDNSFGTSGQVITTFNSLETVYYSVVIQTGMIVAGGNSSEGSVIARYKPSGKIDSTFGINGKIISDFGGNNEGVYGLTLQSDGKIIAAGGAGGKFAVVRYKKNGTHDSTFGTNGFALTAIRNNSYNLGYGVALQSDGKILVAGYSKDKHGARDAVLVRYKKNGQLDSSFGDGGIVVTDLGSSNDTYTSLVIEPNGKINVAGYAGSRLHQDFVLAQYKKNGQLEDSFGSSGIVITDFDSVDDKANSLALEADGKIVLAGSTQSWDKPHYIKFALARYMQNGKLDSAFGTNGKLTTDFGGNSPDNAYAIAIQPDGKIVAAGNSGELAAVARYNSDSSNLHFAKNDVANIQSNKTTTISLSPNPVKDVLYLKGMSTNKKSISIISENGSASQHIVTENSSYTFNTRQLKAGVYFVKITEGEKTTTLKFLKD